MSEFLMRKIKNKNWSIGELGSSRINIRDLIFDFCSFNNIRKTEIIEIMETRNLRNIIWRKINNETRVLKKK